METQKIVNLLNGSENEEKEENFQEENFMLLKTKIKDSMAEEMKMMQPLNLIQKLLNQIFVITQMPIFL